MWTITWTRPALINRCSGTSRRGIGTPRRTTSSVWTSCRAYRCLSCCPWPWPRSYSSGVCLTTERKYKWGPVHDEQLQLECMNLDSCFMWCGHVWLIQISVEDVIFFCVSIVTTIKCYVTCSQVWITQENLEQDFLGALLFMFFFFLLATQHSVIDFSLFLFFIEIYNLLYHHILVIDK